VPKTAFSRRAHTRSAQNDHLVFSRPWLDGPTALAAVLAHSGRMTLATTVGCGATSRGRAEAMLGDVLAPMLNRPVEQLRAVLRVNGYLPMPAVSPRTKNRCPDRYSSTTGAIEISAPARISGWFVE
jgi:hypothetical protein